MDETISPAVLTSNAAQKDYQKIKDSHSQIVNDMRMQADKVAGQQQANTAYQDSRTDSLNQNQNDRIALQQKSDELDLKRMSLP